MIGAFFAVMLASALHGPISIAAIGDSLALGTGATESSNGFTFRLYQRALNSRPGSQITNLAIGGATVDDVLRLEVPRLPESRPDVIFIVAGTNDAIRAHAPALFRERYRALLQAVRAAAPGARLVVFNVPDASVSPIFEASTKAQIHRRAAAYNEIIAGEARAAGAEVVDLFAFSHLAQGDTARYLSSDRFHPSDDGYAAIARQAWPAVERTLR